MKLDRWTNFKFNKLGKVAKNRVVVPPMASQTADSNGFVTDKTINHYKKLSLSGAGIIFVEYSYVHTSGKGEPHQLGIDEDAKVDGLREISSVIKNSGALAGFQLVHVGGKSNSMLTGVPLMGASAIAVPVKDHQMETPVAMRQDEIDNMIGWYVNAAKRVFLSGFDIVELHAAHGYGLNQWLSPLTNRRTDEYGGHILGRAKLLFQIIKEIKATVPNLLVATRLPAQDHFTEGLQVEEMKWVAQILEGLGVDIIDVSSGIGGWRRPQGICGQGYLVRDATKIKKSVSIPIIGVGGIKDGEYIDTLLKNKQLDFAAVGRAILDNPLGWGKQFLNDSNLKITCDF